MAIEQPFAATASGTARLPESVPEAGLLVGWSLESERVRTPMGFSTGDPKKTPATGWIDPILLSGEGHLLTIAPTGAGKGRGCIIPALLRHEGPVIVIDPKGENVAVTARRRRELGQQVVVLDPIGITGETGGSLNPLDLIDPESADSVDLASMFATAFIDHKEDLRNRYWYQRGQQLLIGLMLHAATIEASNGDKKTLARVRQMLAQLVSDQKAAAQAQAASVPSMQTPSPTFRDEFLSSPHPEARNAAGILSSGHEDSIGSIISMAEDGVDFLRGPLIEAATSSTSFDLGAVTRGDPLSIYIVLPPHMLESHGRLLRLWIMALLSLITRRRGKPGRPTLLILDEAAQLGTLPQLRQAITLLRGYGVQTWSFWQDVSQLRHLYPLDWEVMVNNCSVLQSFGAMNLMAAEATASLTGYGGGSAYAVLDLEPHEMLLQIAGEPAVVARKPDYLTDPAFEGLFDPNPYHNTAQPIEPPPPPRISLHRPAKIVPPPIPPGPEEFDAKQNRPIPPEYWAKFYHENPNRPEVTQAHTQLLERLLERL